MIAHYGNLASELNIVRTRYLAHLFVSITSRSVQNFIFISQLLSSTLTLTLTSFNRAYGNLDPELNIIRTRYLENFFVSITSPSVQNFKFLFSTLTLTLTLTLISFNRAYGNLDPELNVIRTRYLENFFVSITSTSAQNFKFLFSTLTLTLTLTLISFNRAYGNLGPGLNIIRTRYLEHLFVSITSRSVRNFNKKY